MRNGKIRGDHHPVENDQTETSKLIDCITDHTRSKIKTDRYLSAFPLFVCLMFQNSPANLLNKESWTFQTSSVWKKEKITC